MLADQEVLVGQQFRSVRFGGEVANSQFSGLLFPGTEWLAGELSLQTLAKIERAADIELVFVVGSEHEVHAGRVGIVAPLGGGERLRGTEFCGSDAAEDVGSRAGRFRFLAEHQCAPAVLKRLEAGAEGHGDLVEARGLFGIAKDRVETLAPFVEQLGEGDLTGEQEVVAVLPTDLRALYGGDARKLAGFAVVEQLPIPLPRVAGQAELAAVIDELLIEFRVRDQPVERESLARFRKGFDKSFFESHFGGEGFGLRRCFSRSDRRELAFASSFRRCRRRTDLRFGSAVERVADSAIRESIAAALDVFRREIEAEEFSAELLCDGQCRRTAGERIENGVPFIRAELDDAAEELFGHLAAVPAGAFLEGAADAGEVPGVFVEIGRAHV